MLAVRRRNVHDIPAHLLHTARPSSSERLYTVVVGN